MFKDKEYIGLALDGDVIRIAQLKDKGGQLHLIKLDKVSLVETIESSEEAEPAQNGDTTNDMEEDLTGGVFGFDETQETSEEPTNGEDEFNFEEAETEQITAEPEPADTQTLDMVEEAGEDRTNDFVLYNILKKYGDKSVELGFNIPLGETIFQVISGTDYNEVKKKDLVEDLEDKLESIYDEAPVADNYSYKITESGSVILASIKEETALLSILNNAREYYSGKMRIRSIYPDEVALASLLRKNYELEDNKISCVIQFGAENCRFLFMKGDEILDVPSLVDNGDDSNVLNKVFSKILFSMDTGKIPGIDQVILANNTIGDEAVDFFKQNFPDIKVEELQYNEDLLSQEEAEDEAVSSFTTAIAAAWAASEKRKFADLQFLPAYVEERQKVFKLKWHGMLLLLLIFSVPFVFNHFYKNNAAKIKSLNNQIELVNTRLAEIEPVVQQTQTISKKLSALSSKLSRIDSLSTGSKVWSAKFSILNSGMSSISNSWLTSLTKTNNGTFIEGYSLYRNRIPAIVDIFAEATLLNVSIEKIRKHELYHFSILIKAFAADSSMFSPDQPETLRKLLDN